MYLQLAALCFVTAFAEPNLKEKNFTGSILSSETVDIDFVTLIMLVDGKGSGRATHLGQLTYTYEFVVDLSTVVGVGSAEFFAANGDSFSTEIDASLAAPGHILETHTIVGGTGRFAGPTGSFILDRLITESNGNVNLSVSTVAGTIVTPKSN